MAREAQAFPRPLEVNDLRQGHVKQGDSSDDGACLEIEAVDLGAQPSCHALVFNRL